MDRKSTSCAYQLLEDVVLTYYGLKVNSLTMTSYMKRSCSQGDIELHCLVTQYQLVDIFTKRLDEPTFKRLIVELGMMNIDSKPEASVLPEEN
ncbi:hypothetical protein Tco_1002270 [Tanacetum coccineum]|uniref:Uncharacterized protein n=1 Tax=Tanacetum coccineum TaxID=301880 RepID=A0ABQ5F7N2_9ASTR